MMAVCWMIEHSNALICFKGVPGGFSTSNLSTVVKGERLKDSTHCQQSIRDAC
jgi:hypothetical protein